MELTIIKIIDHGNPSSEKVILKAEQDLNLYSYAICDNTYKSGTEEFSNERRNFYSFPAMDIRKGEYVILWSKSGNYHKTKTENGNICHNFYWSLTQGVWNNNGDLAVLINIEQIQVHVVKKVKKP